MLPRPEVVLKGSAAHKVHAVWQVAGGLACIRVQLVNEDGQGHGLPRTVCACRWPPPSGAEECAFPWNVCYLLMDRPGVTMESTPESSPVLVVSATWAVAGAAGAAVGGGPSFAPVYLPASILSVAVTLTKSFLVASSA